MSGYLEIEIWNDMHSKVRRLYTEENDHKYVHFWLSQLPMTSLQFCCVSRCLQTIWHHMTFTSFESLFLKYCNGSGIRLNVRTFLLRSYLIDVWIRITALQIQTIINQLPLVIWPIINWNKQSCRQEAFFAILLICNISKVTWDFQKKPYQYVRTWMNQKRILHF